MTFEKLVEANKLIKTISLKDKDYAQVNERVKAFRYLYPNGAIITTLIEDNGERCVFKAEITDGGELIATGHAFEEKASSFVNKTSYIENCETSAIGRSLAMVGLGIDVSIASYEEVNNAINNQNKKAEPTEANGYPSRAEMIKAIKERFPRGGEEWYRLLEYWKVNQIEKATNVQITAIYNKCCQGAK